MTPVGGAYIDYCEKLVWLDLDLGFLVPLHILGENVFMSTNSLQAVDLVGKTVLSKTPLTSFGISQYLLV